MKELSIEEKAKAYDKAIERARVWKEKSGMPADRQGILDDIFPELKESEDERIKRDIIETLHYGLACEESVLMPGATTTLKEALAWLENVIVFSVSNTDKSFIYDIKGIINEAPGVLQSDKNKIIAWLDNVWKRVEHPHIMWKPSEEQMATFWDAICDLNHDGFKWVADLKELYQDLKNLREE